MHLLVKGMVPLTELFSVIGSVYIVLLSALSDGYSYYDSFLISGSVRQY
jgi:hypothetical protein